MSEAPICSYPFQGVGSACPSKHQRMLNGSLASIRLWAGSAYNVTIVARWSLSGRESGGLSMVHASITDTLESAQSLATSYLGQAA